jgi:hypothetical protein
MSYKVEARCCGNDQWTTTDRRFDTKKEAKQYAGDVESRWSLCAETRIVSCDEPPNVRFNPITFRCEGIDLHEQNGGCEVSRLIPTM